MPGTGTMLDHALSISVSSGLHIKLHANTMVKSWLAICVLDWSLHKHKLLRVDFEVLKLRLKLSCYWGKFNVKQLLKASWLLILLLSEFERNWISLLILYLNSISQGRIQFNIKGYDNGLLIVMHLVTRLMAGSNPMYGNHKMVITRCQ